MIERYRTGRTVNTDFEYGWPAHTSKADDLPGLEIKQHILTGREIDQSTGRAGKDVQLDRECRRQRAATVRPVAQARTQREQRRGLNRCVGAERVVVDLQRCR